LLLLTDIIKVGSEILVVSDDENIVKKAFKKDIKNNSFWLDGCLSRKKQVVPILEPCFQK
jgi:manganese-dependent inorganic pyrophosphatase